MLSDNPLWHPEGLTSPPQRRPVMVENLGPRASNIQSQLWKNFMLTATKNTSVHDTCFLACRSDSIVQTHNGTRMNLHLRFPSVQR